jgi:hypothetical protein
MWPVEPKEFDNPVLNHFFLPYYKITVIFLPQYKMIGQGSSLV